ncbi:MAG: class I SAM-dependent methyltransferase [Planctomycetota bacterium]|jgi:tRNA A58 N-methylase Trm61
MIEFDVESLYKNSLMGEVMYNTVLKYKPMKIVEFGVYHGYSTVHMAKALQKLGSGKIVSYDLWDKYPYRHASMEEAQKNVERFGVSDFVELKEGDFFEWIKSPDEFNLLYIDVSNTADVIELAYNTFKKRIESGEAVIMFEGGIKERDQVEWMVKYKKRPICPLKEKIGYEIINEQWPGLSLIARAGAE